VGPSRALLFGRPAASPLDPFQPGHSAELTTSTTLSSLALLGDCQFLLVALRFAFLFLFFAKRQNLALAKGQIYCPSPLPAGFFLLLPFRRRRQDCLIGIIGRPNWLGLYIRKNGDCEYISYKFLPN
jgi:hypothetical protein